MLDNGSFDSECNVDVRYLGQCAVFFGSLDDASSSVSIGISIAWNASRVSRGISEGAFSAGARTMAREGRWAGFCVRARLCTGWGRSAGGIAVELWTDRQIVSGG